MNRFLIVPIILFLITTISVSSISAQSQYDIPSWVKGVAGFWADGKITDQDFGDALTFLITEKIIRIPESSLSDSSEKESELIEENSQLKEEVSILEKQILELENTVLELEKDNMALEDENSQLLDKITSLENEISEIKNSENESTTKPSLTVFTDKEQAYREGEVVKISGQIVDIDDIAISLEIINPNGDVVHSESLSPRSDDSFSTSFVMSDPQNDEFGKYVVIVQFGSVESETSFWYNPN